MQHCAEKAGPETTLNKVDKAHPEFPRRPLWQTLIGTACLGLSFLVLALVFREADVFQDDRFWLSLGLAVWLLALAAIDLDRYLLPDVLTYPLIIAGLGYSYVSGVGPILAFAGAIIGYGLIAGLAWFWRHNFGREGIGLGDAKLLAAIGAWCGIFALPMVLLVSSTSAIALILVLSVGQKSVDRNTAIPFGPLLCLGFWVAWLLS